MSLPVIWALEERLVMAELLSKPKAKPWDIAKGKRFECCHHEVSGGHAFWCMEGLRGKTIRVPKVSCL